MGCEARGVRVLAHPIEGCHVWVVKQEGHMHFVQTGSGYCPPY